MHTERIVCISSYNLMAMVQVQGKKWDHVDYFLIDEYERANWEISTGRSRETWRGRGEEPMQR